jgi:hypothetical protein
MNHFNRRQFDLKRELQLVVHCHKGFTLHRDHIGYYLLGIIKPINGSSEYTIKIEFKTSGHPEVFVLSPDLHPLALKLHRYPSGSLCLYYRPGINWRKEFFVTWTLVPLIHMWLYFYEGWKKYRLWFGPEYPHQAVAKDE